MQTESRGSVTVQLNVRMGEMCDLSDFECGMMVDARRAGSRILIYQHRTLKALNSLFQIKSRLLNVCSVQENWHLSNVHVSNHTV